MNPRLGGTPSPGFSEQLTGLELKSIVEATSGVVGETFFRSLVRHLAALLGVRWTFICEIADREGKRARFISLWCGDRYVEPFEYDTKGTPCEQVVGKRPVFYPSDVWRRFPEDQWLRDEGIESYLAIPLFDSSRRPLGHLGLMHDKPLPESLVAESILGIFAPRVSAELERKRTEEDLRIRTEQLQTVTEAIAHFLEHGDWKAASAMLLRCALEQTGSEYGFAGVVSEKRTLRVLAHEGIVWDKTVNREFYEKAVRAYEEDGYLEFGNLENLFGRTITGGQVVLSNDPGADPRAGGLPPGHPPLRHFLGVPIRHARQVIGMIGVANRPGGYTGMEQGRIEILCRAASILYDNYRRREREIVLENARKQAEATLRAMYDKLEQQVRERTAEISTANVRLQESEQKFRLLVENSPDVIMRLNRDGTILFINHTLPEYTVEKVIGTPVFGYLSGEDGRRYRKALDEVFKTGGPAVLELRASGPTYWLTRLIPLKRDEAVDSVMVIATDISDRRKAEEEREKSLSLLNATLHSTADGILVVDLSGKIVSFNQRFVELWNVPESVLAARDDQQAIASVLDQLKHPREFLNKVEQLYSEPEVESFDILEFKDGRIFERYSRPQKVEERCVGRVWSFRDVTQRKRAEEALLKAHAGLESRVAERTAELSNAVREREKAHAALKIAHERLEHTLRHVKQLSRQVMHAKENEYQAFSRELHDNIAPSINAVKMRLELLGRDVIFGGKQPPDLQESVSMLRQISQDIRALSKQLRPGVIDELGLFIAMKSYLRDLQRRTGIKTRFVARMSEQSFPVEMKIHLYRIMQEALNNISKHSRARNAVVGIRKLKNDFVLSIEDDGTGIPSDFNWFPDEKTHFKGIGLTSISERAYLLGGEAEIKHGKKRGTVVSVRIPLIRPD